MLWDSKAIINGRVRLYPSATSQRAVRSPSPQHQKVEQWEKELGRCFHAEAIPLGWRCPLLAWLASQQSLSWPWAVAARFLHAWLLPELGPHCDSLLVPPQSEAVC